MGKRAKRCQKKCTNHCFLLKPVHYSANFSRELQASFCPQSLDKPSITPKFNKDKHYFTSSFILPIDYKKLSNNQEYYRTSHQKYKMENINEKSSMRVAKPRSKSSYCNVCKCDYDDYLDHIKSIQHKDKIKENKFNSFIDEMCHVCKVKVQEGEQKMEENTLQFCSEATLPSSQEFLNLEIRPNPIQQNTFFQGFQHQQMIDLLQSTKSFHFFAEIGEQNSIRPNNQEHYQGTVAPFSPMKRYSEVTDGMRSIGCVKPIIINEGINKMIKN